MKFTKRFMSFFVLSAFAVILSGCANSVSSSSSTEYGSIVFSENSSERLLNRAVDNSEITTAEVTVSGYGMSDIVKENVAIIGGKGSATIERIPVGTNRVVKVQSNVSGAVLYAVTDINPGENLVTINWEESKLGHIYWELLKTQKKDVSSIKKSVFDGCVPDVHAALVDAVQIAEDYPDFKSASSYVLTNGSVILSSTGVDGYKIRITDLSSEVVDGNVSDRKLVCTPGSWKVQVLDANGDVVKSEAVNVFAGYETKVNVSKSEAVTDKIVVKVPESKNYKYIYIWETSDSSINRQTFELEKNDGYYSYSFNVTSAMVILRPNGGSDWSGQTGNLQISEPGLYVFNGSSFDKTSGDGEIKISVVEPELPKKPSYTMTSKSALGGKINISVTSNCELTTASVTIGGVTKQLVIGDNIFEVADFTTVAKTLSVSGSITNEAGTVNISGSIEIADKPTLISDWNELRIYQVMVSSFMDGDSSIGYSYAYGPSTTYDYYTGSSSRTITGGDLQGIINAADYIADLGVNAIWMTPIFDSSSGENNEYLNSTGYFCYDYFNIDPKFGTNQKFAELVETYHNKGIYVILDGVFGHWNGAGVKASPTGKTAVRKNGQYKACAYPDSLEFFKEVAQYWIKEYKIDGWRFDQCYQVGNGDKTVGDNSYTNDHNYWYEIRTAIAEAAADNAQAGEEWGTLGYTVGEHWNGDAATIQRGSVAPGENGEGYGLQSCFDFPSRYRLVQTMAREEGTNTATDFGAAMEYTYGTYTEKGYTHPEGYYPNLFFTNHDLVRYGNLLNWKFSIDPTTEEYFTRHKLMLAVLAGYSGPITTYYGDEWGAIVKGYDVAGSLGAYNDNMARSNGKISGFTDKEADLIDYYKSIMGARAAHPALWKGDSETVSSTTEFYVVKKTYGSEVIYIAFNNSKSSKSFSANGKDLVTGNSYTGTVTVPALSAVFVLAK